jgi:myosin heavy subunit
LDKNKDPLNETVVGTLSESKEPLVAEFFKLPPGKKAFA